MYFRLYRPPGLVSRPLVVLLVAVGVFGLFFCSGLHLPVWNSRARLNKHLADDLRLSLPASATVTHAVSVAYRDPGEYYAIEMAAADVAPFMAMVRNSTREPKDVDPASNWHMGRVPSWWKPQDLPQVQRLDMNVENAQGIVGGYMWYYSPSATTVYVFWFRT